jgi:aspartate carbamoyltransferase catalytic subunit
MAALRHVLDARQFSREWLLGEFFPEARKMEGLVGLCGPKFSGKRMIIFFTESSTRTFASFHMAASYLDVQVPFSTESATASSSMAKGESLTDTIRVLDQYRPDVIVLRCGKNHGPEEAAQFSRAVIINAGDGTNQHPTQALLDVYTFWKRFGRIEGLAVAIVGDLARGRTVRSLCYLLSNFKGVKIYFVAPESARAPKDVKDYLKGKNILFEEGGDLGQVAPLVDVVYQTRIQTERGSTIDPAAKQLLVVDKRVLGLMRETAIVAHPLPRVDEITPDVDSDPRAVYLTYQVFSGLVTRMALLKMILG